MTQEDMSSEKGEAGGTLFYSSPLIYLPIIHLILQTASSPSIICDYTSKQLPLIAM